VIQTVDIGADATWLGNHGWFHSGQMKMTDKLRRVGNTLTVDMTIEDPWVPHTQHANLNANSKALFVELNARAEPDSEHLVGTE
jgi:hypothetical protein